MLLHRRRPRAWSTPWSRRRSCRGGGSRRRFIVFPTLPDIVFLFHESFFRDLFKTHFAGSEDCFGSGIRRMLVGCRWEEESGTVIAKDLTTDPTMVPPAKDGASGKPSMPAKVVAQTGPLL